VASGYITVMKSRPVYNWHVYAETTCLLNITPSITIAQRNVVTSVTVCMSVCENVSGTTRPNCAKFSVHVACGHSLFLTDSIVVMLITTRLVVDAMFVARQRRHSGIGCK